MHKSEKDGKWRNNINVTSNPWTHDYKMKSGKVVKSNLRMHQGDINLLKNNTQPHQMFMGLCLHSSTTCTSTSKFWEDFNPNVVKISKKDFYWFVMHGLGKGGYEKFI